MQWRKATKKDIGTGTFIISSHAADENATSKLSKFPSRELKVSLIQRCQIRETKREKPLYKLICPVQISKQKKADRRTPSIPTVEAVTL